jgi:hypothetical protein
MLLLLLRLRLAHLWRHAAHPLEAQELVLASQLKVAKTAAVAAVFPIGRAAVFIARQVSGAGAVETAPAHHHKPVGPCLVGAVAGRIDARCINLHRNVDDWIRLDVLGGVLVAFAAAVPVVLLLLEVELSDDALELRKAGGVRRAVGQALLATAKEQTKGASVDKRNAKAGEKPEQVWGFIAMKPRLIYK